MRAKARKQSSANPLRPLYIASALLALVIAAGVGLWQMSCVAYRGEPVWVKIPAGATAEAVTDSIHSALGKSYGSRVATLWRWMGAHNLEAAGSYQITPGMRAWRIARAIDKGRQTPVNVTFNNIRTIDQLAKRISDKLDFTPQEFLDACTRVLPAAGFEKAQFPAAFIPDTYQFYYTDSATKVVEKLLAERNRFWTDQRRAQASALGLTPVGVATIASIVEEETNAKPERPMVARLYLNRLEKGMRLQADPTVKFAVGDFTLRRITGTHLSTESPYNTYRHAGLPPGPIRIAERATLLNVLEAPQHDYIYMCAKSDFSGMHDFATSYSTHQQNAKNYQKALDDRGIK